MTAVVMAALAVRGGVARAASPCRVASGGHSLKYPPCDAGIYRRIEALHVEYVLSRAGGHSRCEKISLISSSLPRHWRNKLAERRAVYLWA